MTAEATTRTPGPQHGSQTQIGEWVWRFLAMVMLFMVVWVVWIAIQISPPAIVLPAAYQAAAEGRASRSSGGAIAVAVAPTPSLPDAPGTVIPADPVTSPEAAVLPVVPVVVAVPTPVEPPVNLERLRLAQSIETPIVQRPRRVAKPAPEVTQ